MATTIRDVARAAGVSTMTVSNVINDRPYVKPETRERVLAAIADLDYRVNVAAKRLRDKRSRTIALAVPEVNLGYFGLLADQVIRAAAAHGYRVVVERTGATQETELESVALSQRLQFDGLILSSSGIDDPDLLAVNYPIVVLGERTYSVPVPHIAMPNEDGAEAAVQHLVNRGARRIVLLGGDVTVDGIASLRFDGYSRAHRANGLPIDDALIRQAGGYTMSSGHEAVRSLLAEGTRFDAVFAMTDTVAIGALHALYNSGVRVPEDVQLMGFDDIPESAFSNPALTTIRPDHEFIAETAVRLILEHVAGTRPRVGQRLQSPFRLVERASTRTQQS